MKNETMEELALNLLDFCGGDIPTNSDLHEWIIRHGHEFGLHKRNLILQIASQLILMS